MPTIWLTRLTGISSRLIPIFIPFPVYHSHFRSHSHEFSLCFLFPWTQGTHGNSRIMHTSTTASYWDRSGLWWTWGVAWGEAPKAAKKTSAVLHVPSVSPLKQTWNCTLRGHVCYTSLKLGHFGKLLGKLGLWECRLKLLSFLCTHRNASMRHFRFQASCENFYSYIFTLHLRQVRRL